MAIVHKTPRNQLRILDSRTGSYPTIARTGDKRTGVYDVFFDDSKILNFVTQTHVQYPSLLLTGSALATNLSGAYLHVKSGSIVDNAAGQFVEFSDKYV